MSAAARAAPEPLTPAPTPSRPGTHPVVTLGGSPASRRRRARPDSHSPRCSSSRQYRPTSRYRRRYIGRTGLLAEQVRPASPEPPSPAAALEHRARAPNNSPSGGAALAAGPGGCGQRGRVGRPPGRGAHELRPLAQHRRAAGEVANISTAAPPHLRFCSSRAGGHPRLSSSGPSRATSGDPRRPAGAPQPPRTPPRSARPPAGSRALAMPPPAQSGHPHRPRPAWFPVAPLELVAPAPGAGGREMGGSSTQHPPVDALGASVRAAWLLGSGAWPLATPFSLTRGPPPLAQ